MVLRAREAHPQTAMREVPVAAVVYAYFASQRPSLHRALGHARGEKEVLSGPRGVDLPRLLVIHVFYLQGVCADYLVETAIHETVLF